MADRTKTQSTSAPAAPATRATELAADAYIFGYPLVIMDVTRRLATNVARPEMAHAPTNQFAHMRAFPDASFTDVVSPNADTLYSAAWLDLTAEPIVLSVPDMGDRYYLMPMLDAWTNVFASPGTRTTGNGAGHFAIAGPTWTGTPPDGVTLIHAPTNLVWVIGRTQTNGSEDFDAVRAIQEHYTLTPLSVWAKQGRAGEASAARVDPSVDNKTPPVEQVDRMDAATFFGRLNSLMVGNPPSAEDAEDIARFEVIGIGPGKALDPKGLDPALEAGMKLGRERLVAEVAKPHGTRVNGWDILPSNTGRYGTDYSWRAVVARLALGANVPEDAIYPHATTDASGQPLDGSNTYVIRFTKGATPPVKAFWSVTMYNAKQALVDNPIDRYAIGDRDALTFDGDGSLTLFIQHDSPGKERESNWLPAPTDAFNLALRLYWPSPQIIDGTWKPPAVEKIR